MHVPIVLHDPHSNDSTPSQSDQHADVSDDNLHIALHKDTRKCTLPKVTYPIVNYISYNRISHSSNSLIASIDSILVPKIKESLCHPGWHGAMFEEINALDENRTWEFVDT